MLDDSKQIGVYVDFSFKQGKQTSLKIKVSCHFSISPKSWENFLGKDKNTIIFPIGFMRHLTVLTIGMARGVLHCKTERKEFNKYVLPTINVNNLISEDVEFELELGSD